MQQTTRTWMQTLSDLLALATEAQARTYGAAAEPTTDDVCVGGEAFIEPRKAHLAGYLTSHLNYFGEQVDSFLNECGRICLITNHADGSLTVDGERYTGELIAAEAL